MPAKVKCGIFAEVDVPTWEEHRQISDQIGPVSNRVNEHQQVISATNSRFDALDGASRKHSDDLQNAKGKLTELERMCSARQAENWESLQKLQSDLNAMAQRLDSATFEKEIMEMFQRQFSTFDNSCKAYAQATADLQLEAAGVERFLEQQRAKHDNALQQQVTRHMANLDQSLQQKVQALEASLEETGNSLSRSLAQVQQELINTLEERCQSANEKTSLLWKNLERASEAIAVVQGEMARAQVSLGSFQEAARRYENELGIVRSASQHLRSGTWRAFWNRLRWLLTGRIGT